MLPSPRALLRVPNRIWDSRCHPWARCHHGHRCPRSHVPSIRTCGCPCCSCTSRGLLQTAREWRAHTSPWLAPDPCTGLSGSPCVTWVLHKATNAAEPRQSSGPGRAAETRPRGCAGRGSRSGRERASLGDKLPRSRLVPPGNSALLPEHLPCALCSQRLMLALPRPGPSHPAVPSPLHRPSPGPLTPSLEGSEGHRGGCAASGGLSGRNLLPQDPELLRGGKRQSWRC